MHRLNIREAKSESIIADTLSRAVLGDLPQRSNVRTKFLTPKRSRIDVFSLAGWKTRCC
jgi:hypothetical protein